MDFMGFLGAAVSFWHFPHKCVSRRILVFGFSPVNTFHTARGHFFASGVENRTRFRLTGEPKSQVRRCSSVSDHENFDFQGQMSQAQYRIHHILFVNSGNDPQVLALTEFPMKKKISIPSQAMDALKKHLEHDGKTIIPTYEGVGKTEESKVRFDRKAECAYRLGIIEPWLRDELVEFYEARNSIHIHAEIKKSLNYELDLSKRAYRRLQPFKEQIIGWQLKQAG